MDQTENVTWYLDEASQHTNESMTGENYTSHAEYIGEHNVSTVATNANGTDMQEWVWNVTTAPTDATALVKDINLIGVGSAPADPVAVGTTLYFSANDGTNGYELSCSGCERE